MGNYISRRKICPKIDFREISEIDLLNNIKNDLRNFSTILSENNFT